MPLGLFALFATGLFAPADRAVKSAMVGKPMPDFTLPALVPGKPGVSSKSFADGKPRLVNVFASWCGPCIAEAPQLMQLKNQGVEIVGIATADTPEDMARFLSTAGDPFTAIGKRPRLHKSSPCTRALWMVVTAPAINSWFRSPGRRVP